MKITFILIGLIFTGFITKSVYVKFNKVDQGIKSVYSDSGIYSCIQRKVKAKRLPINSTLEISEKNRYMNGCKD